MKMIVCTICGKEITKRQSLSIGDGKRACRSHEETQEKSQALLQTEKDCRELQKKARLRKKKEKQHGTIIPLKPRCFVCQLEGLRQDDYGIHLMAEEERFEITYGRHPSFLDVEDRKKLFSALPRCLWFVEWKGENKKVRLPYASYQVGELAGFILACSDCCEKHGLVKYTVAQLEQDSNLLDTLQKFAAVCETVRPTIAAAVSSDIAARN